MDCKTFEKRIFDYFDKTISDSELQEFEGHLHECWNCSANLKTHKAVLSEASNLDKCKAPDTLWAQIETQLEQKKSPFLSRLLAGMESWKDSLETTLKISAPVFQVAAVATILILGVFVGRHFFPTTQQVNLGQATAEPQGKAELVAARTNNFVEKSKILFLGIVNADATEIQDSDWNTEKRMAHNLVREAAVLKDDWSQMKAERIKLLIDELELILLEIANLEEEHDVENIELIKSGIDRKGLMLKIHLHDLSEKPLFKERSSSLEVL